MGIKLEGIERLEAAFRQIVDKQIPERVSRFHRMVTLLLHSKIVEKTPVDTGRARVSWIATVARASESFSPPIKGSQSAQAAARSLAQAAAAMDGLPPYSQTFIANNLPYIRRLEEGYSSQAPSGMVGLSIQEIITFLESAA